MGSPAEGSPGRSERGGDRAVPSRESGWVVGLAASDPHGELIDRSGTSREELAQIDELMAALFRLRAAEKELSEASLRFMKLNETDMRALHFLIVSENQQRTATPGAIADFLGISSASTTKLLDRLQRGGHIRREPHPHDRRAFAIRIEPATRAAAMRSVGSQQARRFHAAKRLTAAERDVVTRFLDDMAQEISIHRAEWAHED